VGGRALNGQPGEENQGLEEIGRLKPNGFLSGHFAADPGSVIEVDHIIGCNMSFRRDVLARLGGFREDALGISGLCEDSDICLRVQTMGYKLRFQPAACVDHVGAPQARGRRFGIAYEFYHRRNSAIMLIRNFGLAPIVWRFPIAITGHMARELMHGLAKAGARFIASFAGLLVGVVTGISIYARDGCEPERRDAAGQAIRAALGKEGSLSASTVKPSPLL
jgi:GT2 family glycosyltransferase